MSGIGEDGALIGSVGVGEGVGSGGGDYNSPRFADVFAQVNKAA